MPALVRGDLDIRSISMLPHCRFALAEPGCAMPGPGIDDWRLIIVGAKRRSRRMLGRLGEGGNSRPSDIVFLDLPVESSASNFELPGSFPQIPVCLLQYLSDQSLFCKEKRVGREVKDKALSKGKVS